MKKIFGLFLTGVMVLGTLTGCGGNNTQPSSSVEKQADTTQKQEAPKKEVNSQIVWYAPAPHPYFDEVKQGVEQFSKDQGIEVKM